MTRTTGIAIGKPPAGCDLCLCLQKAQSIPATKRKLATPLKDSSWTHKHTIKTLIGSRKHDCVNCLEQYPKSTLRRRKDCI